jgi:hypothetical protein
MVLWKKNVYMKQPKGFVVKGKEHMGSCETWVPTGFPPTRLTAVPDKWVRPTRRPADLLVGPTDLVGGPHDLPKTFQKIPKTI